MAVEKKPKSVALRAFKTKRHKYKGNIIFSTSVSDNYFFSTSALRGIPQIVPLRKAGGRPRCSLECLQDPSKSFTFAGSKQHDKDRYVCLDCKDYAKKFRMCR